jgi:transposase-like protein
MVNYSQEFKGQIVEQHRQGRTFMELAKEFNLAATSISNWGRAAEKRAVACLRSRTGAHRRRRGHRLAIHQEVDNRSTGDPSWTTQDEDFVLGVRVPQRATLHRTPHPV